ncbi:MAG: hypothetical protein JWO21_466 [Solirubrobacterales bacterium]|nr:hypothetical protein [Solirubrobacterales bacterium]
MSEVFVTGGSGFIGGRLIERLRADGHAVRALARSSAAAERVRASGAEPIDGELADVAAMRAGAEGCELAFHAAATLGDWGRREDFERGNVQGTKNVLEACTGAGVRRLVHVSTEAVLLAGRPLVEVDETAPLRPDSPALTAPRRRAPSRPSSRPMEARSRRSSSARASSGAEAIRRCCRESSSSLAGGASRGSAAEVT